ncbi:MAG TPA: carboxypeptidase-like regulatory domain-containing protein [Candidatus Micrarchaeaceae archaeon]|nr:carboxypeptidase-like regulatory domain-containing protein [Candidatus Micrarchaeaceae archaeon]
MSTWKMPWLVFAVLIFLLPAVSHAQSPTTGAIGGVVRDPAGAAVPTAHLVLTSQAGVLRESDSSDNGRYIFPLLPPGVYKLVATKPGFASTTLDSIVVRITEITPLDVSLALASQKSTVEVTAEPPMVQIDNATRGDVIGSTTIRQLPLATRNFQQLLTLTPGTSGPIPNSSDLGRGDTAFNVNGQRTLSNAVVINGIDASSIGTGSTPNLAVPASDTLQEFIVQTSLYDASQGRNAGSVVAAVTKSGTDQFHGNAYEFLRNDDLDANNFFLKGAGIPRQPYKRNQFGGTLGGPIVKQRAWFFGSYQGTREVNGTSLENSVGTVFVPGALTNDRSTPTLTALANSLGVPAIDPTALFLLQAQLPNGQFVIPSAPPGSNPAALAVAAPVAGISRFREDQFNANADLKLTEADRLSEKFFWANNPETQALFNSFGLANSLPVPGFGAQVNFNQRVLSIDETHVFSSTLLNDFRFGWATITTTSVPQEPFTAAQLGITSPLGSLFPGMPEISVTNFFDLGASPFSDNSAQEPTYTVGDSVTLQKGKHSLKFGFEYKHHELTENFNLYTRGQMFFLGVTGDPFVDFLGGAGDTTGLSIIGSGVNHRDILSHDLSGYFNDDWRITDRLTLTLGLRYEYFAPFTEAQGRYVGLDPDKITTTTIPFFPVGDNIAITGGFVQAANAKGALAGVPSVQNSIVPPDKNNFAPRLGFAFRPLANNDSLVIRGGYGVYYDRPNSRIVNNQLLDFPYFLLAQAFFTPISDPFVTVPLPSQFPLQLTNNGIFPFAAGPPAFLPAPVLGGFQAVPATGLFLNMHDFRTPYIQQYSLGFQDEFAKNWLLDVAYVGSIGRKLLRLRQINQAPVPIATTPGPLSPGLSALAVQGFGIHEMESSSNSSYNSLQASLTKRFSNGLQFLASYTYSHSLDDYSGDPSGTSDVTVVPGNQEILNNYASSDFDRRHRFVFSGIYDFPDFYKGDSRFAKEAANGWEVASIFTIQSGQPFSVLTAATAFVQARADFASAAPCNPYTSGSTLNRLGEYFNLACFAPAGADFGNTGRNLLVGPNQKDVDISIVKYFPVTERTNFEFRTEFFNAFNNVSFANPVNILTSLTPGQIVATTVGPRVIQFALKFTF